MNNQDILAARVGAVLRCRLLEGNDHAAQPASCTASHQHHQKRNIGNFRIPNWIPA